jgi:mannose-6-phosphate isomerase-like protein (cupin superfamily)
MSTHTQPFTLEPGAGLAVPAFAGRMEFKIVGEQCDGAMTLFETESPPGAGPPLHLHEGQDEWLYVLEGEIRVRIGDDILPVRTGAFVFIPRGTVHCWQTVGSVPCRFLGFLSPAGMDRFFREFAALPEHARTADSFAALAAIGGMTVVGPPLAVTHPLPAPVAA